jgi:hypothetical protein
MRTHLFAVLIHQASVAGESLTFSTRQTSEDIIYQLTWRQLRGAQQILEVWESAQLEELLDLAAERYELHAT